MSSTLRPTEPTELSHWLSPSGTVILCECKTQRYAPGGHCYPKKEQANKGVPENKKEIKYNYKQLKRKVERGAAKTKSKSEKIKSNKNYLSRGSGRRFNVPNMSSTICSTNRYALCSYILSCLHPQLPESKSDVSVG